MDITNTFFPHIFKCIFANDVNKRRYMPWEIIESVLTIDELRSRLIVAIETNHAFTYTTFASFADYEKAKLEHCHEVIFGWRPQRLKFDIDATNADYSETSAGELVTDVQAAITTAFERSYNIDLPPDSFIITDSSGQSGTVYKFSFHIIVRGFYVNNNVEAAEFTKRMLQALPVEHHGVIDPAVNKSLQNFRMLNATKTGSDRVKTLAVPLVGVTAEQTLITNIQDCVELAPIARDERDVNNKLVGPLADIIDKAAPFTTGLTFSEVKHGVICYTRQRPSNCPICKRQHNTDNTAMITTSGYCELVNIFLSCRRAPKKRLFIGSINGGASSNKLAKHVAAVNSEQAPKATTFMPRIDDESDDECGDICDNQIVKLQPSETHSEAENIADTDDYMAAPMALMAEKRAENCEASSTPRKPVNAKSNIAVINKYSLPSLRDYELVDTLCVRANMKMGKTKALISFIKDNFSANARIVFVSFRRTFSANIKRVFSDFTMYSDVIGDLSNFKRLIVQVESMHRFGVSKRNGPPDLLILDESELIFEQFSSGLHKHFNAAWATFKWLMRYSKHAVFMDACMADRTFNIVGAMRGPVTLHWNTWSNATEDNVHFTDNDLRWTASLYDDLAAKKRIGIPISSLNRAEILIANINKRFPKVNIKLYSSKSLESEKRKHFSDIDEFWSQYDVVVYTPTVSAGVSFERAHFDKIYGYFTSMSCDVEVCVQMLGRIRNVSSRDYYICTDHVPSFLPTTAETIEACIYSSRQSVFQTYDADLLTFEYNAEGEKKYTRDEYFTLWLENKRTINLSHVFFSERFVDIMAATGAQCSIMEPLADESGFAAIYVEITGMQIALRAIEQEQIASAPELTALSLHAITAKFGEDDLTETEQNSYKKYTLRRDFNYGIEITPQFVGVYNSNSARFQYRTLKTIHCEPTIDESLACIRQRERDRYTMSLTSTESWHHTDIRRSYVFDTHRVAIAAIRALGFEPFVDSFLGANTAFNTLRPHAEKLCFELKKMSAVVDVPPPKEYVWAADLSDDNIRQYIISDINNYMMMVYDMRIVFDCMTVSLEVSKRFDFSAAEPPGPLPNITADWEIPG